jgi:hypothetical protein
MKKSLVGLSILSFAATGADIYYEDGGYVNVPDEWVEIVPKTTRLDCDAIPDDPRCGQGYIEWEHAPPSISPGKYLKQGSFDRVTSGSW